MTNLNLLDKFFYLLYYLDMKIFNIETNETRYQSTTETEISA